MSSMLRTIQKRILKRAGFAREKTTIDIVNGTPVRRDLKRGEGNIVNRSGDSFGKHWPMTVPAIGSGKGSKGHTLHRARGSRRGRPNKGWLNAAAAKRAAQATA